MRNTTKNVRKNLLLCAAMFCLMAVMAMPAHAVSSNGVDEKGQGENIGWDEATPEEVFESWMASESHRANILNPNVTKMGVGYSFDANSAWGHQWVQLFV